MSGMVLSKVSSMTQVISGTTSLCGYSYESMKFLVFNVTPHNAYFIMPIIHVNFVNSKYELLFTYSRILPVLVFCVFKVVE